MSRIKACVVLTAWVATGCAGSHEVADEAGVAAPAVVAASDAAAPGGASANAAPVVPDRVVDANELVANTPPRPICREMLIFASNVHETRCMSAETWKIWDAAEARRAAEVLRSMQSGTYR